MSEELTLSQAIALALVGTADPCCELCGAPAFVNCGGHLYCKAEWQEGACNEQHIAADAPMAEGAAV